MSSIMSALHSVPSNRSVVYEFNYLFVDENRDHRVEESDQIMTQGLQELLYTKRCRVNLRHRN